MKDTDNQSWLDLIGKGFWLGVGFTVAFVIVTTIFTLLYAGIANVYMEREAAAMTRATEEQLRILRNAFQQTLPKVVKPSVQTQVKPEGAVRYFGKPKQLSKAEQQERDCNLAILRFSQTNNETDKQDVYRLCPETN